MKEERHGGSSRQENLTDLPDVSKLRCKNYHNFNFTHEDYLGLLTLARMCIFKKGDPVFVRRHLT